MTTREDKLVQSCIEFIESRLNYARVLDFHKHSEDYVIAANALGYKANLYTLFLARLADYKQSLRVEQERKAAAQKAIAEMKAKFNK